MMVRKESTQIIKDIIPGLNNDEKEVYQLVIINILSYLGAIWDFVLQLAGGSTQSILKIMLLVDIR